MVEDITLCLVHALVVALFTQGQPLHRHLSCVAVSSGGHPYVRTQFLLKQSWAQKKLSLTPSFKHVGHCSAPASLSQSAPRHFFLVGGSAAMVKENRDAVCRLKGEDRRAAQSDDAASDYKYDKKLDEPIIQVDGR